MCVFEALPGETCIDVLVLWLLRFIGMPMRLKISRLISNLLRVRRLLIEMYCSHWLKNLTFTICTLCQISPIPQKIIKIIILIFWVTSNIFEGWKKEAPQFRLLENSPWTAVNANHNLTGKSGTCFSFCQRKSWDFPSWSDRGRQISPLVQRILYRLLLKQVWFALWFVFFFLGKTPDIFPLLLYASSLNWAGLGIKKHLFCLIFLLPFQNL